MTIVQKQNVGRYSKRGKKSHALTFGDTASAPTTLGRIAQYFKDQGASGYCTAAARSAAGSYYFKKDMSFEYQTAKEGEVAGSPIYNGAFPNQASQASELYGFLPTEQSPLSFVKDGWTTAAVWQNYPPALDGQAIVNGGMESYNVNPTYEDIKNALIVGNESNSVVIANGFWYAPWNNSIGGIVPVPTTSPITRHSYIFIDFLTMPDGIERLVAQLSQGTAFGVGGLLYFSAEALNTAFSNPIFRGIGCEQFMQSNNAQNEEMSLYERLIEILGQIADMVKGV